MADNEHVEPTIADIINKWAGAIRNCREDEKIKDYFGANNKIILLTRPYSMHPDDWYLSVILFQVEFGVHPYVVSLYNSEGNFYFEDRYFKDKQEAFDFWKEKK